MCCIHNRVLGGHLTCLLLDFIEVVELDGAFFRADGEYLVIPANVHGPDGLGLRSLNDLDWSGLHNVEDDDLSIVVSCEKVISGL